MGPKENQTLFQGLCMLSQVKQGWKEKFGASSARQLLPQVTCPSVPAPWNLSCASGPSASLPFSFPFNPVNSVRLFSWISLLFRSWNRWLAIKRTVTNWVTSTHRTLGRNSYKPISEQSRWSQKRNRALMWPGLGLGGLDSSSFLFTCQKTLDRSFCLSELNAFICKSQ